MEIKKNKGSTLSELIVDEIESQMIKGINKKKYNENLHIIITDKIKEWMK